jgi:hypothetical protein
MILAEWDPRCISSGRTPRKTASSVVKMACLHLHCLLVDVLLLRVRVGMCLTTRYLAVGIRVRIYVLSACSRKLVTKLADSRSGVQEITVSTFCEARNFIILIARNRHRALLGASLVHSAHTLYLYHSCLTNCIPHPGTSRVKCNRQIFIPAHYNEKTCDKRRRLG